MVLTEAGAKAEADAARARVAMAVFMVAIFELVGGRSWGVD